MYYSPDEWDRLPWFQQTMYIEGINEEFGLQQEDPDYEDDPDGAPAPDIGGFGANVIHAQFGTQE